jgi:hypothetical protein
MADDCDSRHSGAVYRRVADEPRAVFVACVVDGINAQEVFDFFCTR